MTCKLIKLQTLNRQMKKNKSKMNYFERFDEIFLII